MRLTEQQVNYFDTFGFLAFPGLFADEAGRISDAFESIWAMHGGGHDGRPHDHQRRSALIEFIDREEFLCSLIDDPRIDDVAASLLGDDYNYTGSDGNYYVGDTQWHSDRYVPAQVHVLQDGLLPRPRGPTTPAASASYPAATSSATPTPTPSSRSPSSPGRSRPPRCGVSAPTRSPPCHSRPSPETSSCSTTAPSTPPSAAAPNAECSPSTSRSASPKRTCPCSAKRSARAPGSGGLRAYGEVMIRTAGPESDAPPRAAPLQRQPPTRADPKGQRGDGRAIQELNPAAPAFNHQAGGSR